MESQQVIFRETTLKDENYEKKKEETSPCATVTTRALRGKREKSLIPQSPRKTQYKRKRKPMLKWGDFSVGRIS